MEEKSKNSAIRNRRRLFSVLGLFPKAQDPADRTLDIESRKSLYAANELAALHASTKGDKDRKHGNLQQHLSGTSEKISKMIGKTESFNSMLPEADKARAIYIPSIMSPTDMYGNSFTISLEGCTFPDEVQNSINELFADMVNSDLELGNKVPTWIGDAMFKKGATAVMVVPKQLNRELSSDVELDANLDGNSDVEVDDNDGKAGVQGKLSAGTENYDITPEFLNISSTANDIDFSLEAMSGVFHKHEEIAIEKDSGNKIHNVLNELTQSLRGEITVSMDISKIRGATEAAQENVKAFEERSAGRISKVSSSKSLIISGNSIAVEDGDFPLVVRLPTSSVIPVTVPGSPESRLGYFVVNDSSGNPINADITGKSEASMSQSLFMKTFTSNNSGMLINNAAAEKRSEVASDLFDIIIEQVLGNSLNKVAGDETKSAVEYNIVNNRDLGVAIFNRILRKEKISFIFVPTTHMAYYAFEYREDGTGKTLLEDASTLIALRTSCIIAKVVSVMDSARDNRRIEYSLADADGTNLEQINEMLSRMYREKHKPNLSHNTDNILETIIDNSMTIAPKQFEGLEDFSITTETTNANLSSVDDSLEEMLTRMITLYLRVPAGAIDDVHEKDFSRSVATSNILFSNDVRLAQQITCRETTTIAKAVAINSSTVVKKLRKILKDATSLQLPDGVTEEDLVRYVINSMQVSLPAPNVSPDRTRLSEISENIRTISDVIDGMWAEELLVVDDDSTRRSLLAYKQFLKHVRIRELVANAGDANLAAIPGMDDMDPDLIRKLNQVMVNIGQMGVRMKEAMVVSPDASGGGGSRW